MKLVNSLLFGIYHIFTYSDKFSFFYKDCRQCGLPKELHVQGKFCSKPFIVQAMEKFKK